MLADDLTSFFKLNIGSTDRLVSMWEASKAYIRGKCIAQAARKKKEGRDLVKKLEASKLDVLQSESLDVPIKKRSNLQ